MADLEALRRRRAWAVAEEVALQRRLRDEGAASSDLLHPVIGRCADEDRSLLVALRRAVFQGRRPTGRVWSARRSLPGGIGERVERRADAVARAAPRHGTHGRRVTEDVFELSATDPHG